jgi:hypothetical protein
MKNARFRDGAGWFCLQLKKSLTVMSASVLLPITNIWFSLMSLAYPLLFSFLLLRCTASAQIDTTLRDFFPMQIGNYWEYIDEDFPEPSIRYSLSVVGDTTMPNGRLYRKFQRRLIPSGDTDRFYFRLDDSLRVYEYIRGASRCTAREYLLFDLSIRDRMIWPICLDYIPNAQDYLGLLWTRRYFLPLLRLDTLTKFYLSAIVDTTTGDTLWDAGLLYGHGRYWLSHGLGIVRSQGDASSPDNIVGAIVNGRRYGTISDVREFSRKELVDLKMEDLYQNYPNPFNAMTRIRYDLPHRGYASVVVYDQLGREVAIVVDGWHEMGSYSVVFDAPPSLSTGVYYYALKTAQKTTYNKMTIIK